VIQWKVKFLGGFLSMEIESKKRLNYKELYILILYAISLLRSIGAWNIVPTSIDSMIFNIVGLAGGIILLIEVVQIILRKKPFDYDILLVLFLIIFGISILLNYKYNFFANVKNFAWSALFLLTIYSVAKNKNTQENFFVKFQTILVSFGFIMSLISLGMFVFNYSYITPLENKTNPLRLGFIENRLFGAYADPNYAAVMAVVVIVFSLYLLLYKCKNVLFKVLLIINIILQIFYIGLSGSRNGLVVLLAITAVYTFFNVFYSKREAIQKNILSRVIIGVIAAGLASSVMFLAVDVSKRALSVVPDVFPAHKIISKNNSSNNKQTDEPVDLSREDIAGSGDISNMRFTLWKSGIEVFKTSPLFGVAPKSIHDYAQKEVPNTYLAKTHLAVHNAYLNVLVCTGIFGALAALAFLGKNAYNVIKYAFMNNIKNNRFLYYMLAVLALAISGLFHNEIFFMTTSSPLVFWVFLAGLNNVMSQKKQKQEK
jgi:O-antigen ligase